MTNAHTSNWSNTRRQWPLLRLYERFEAAVAFLLTVVIGAVILVALYRLVVSVVDTLLLQAMNPLDHVTFQRVFGEIMTLLIALEFNHTLHYVVTGERSIVHTKTVILIAQLALARKVIVMDLLDMPLAFSFGLAALILGLGVTYWLIRDQDQRASHRDAPPDSAAFPSISQPRDHEK